MRLGWFLLVAVLGCGGAREGGGSGASANTRGAICFDLAQRLCEPGQGCFYRHMNDEYECRAWFRYECCGRSESCDQRLEVDFARLVECRRGIEHNIECNRLHTPACFELLPASDDTP